MKCRSLEFPNSVRSTHDAEDNELSSESACNGSVHRGAELNSVESLGVESRGMTI